jgi:hypothetical protein
MMIPTFTLISPNFLSEARHYRERRDEGKKLRGDPPGNLVEKQCLTILA